jgi:tetratricopeptide (TPR) repeat protein
MRLMIILLTGIGVVAIAVFGANSFLKPEVVANAPAVRNRTDQRIVRAQQAVERMPNSAESHNQLAAAYMQKARETSDHTLNTLAETSITRALAIDSMNYDSLKLRGKLELTNHRFADALQTTRLAQSIRNDDHEVWGQITDALVELGDYPGAVKAAQRMVDLRPDSSSYARVAYLRSLHGDIEGAIAAMTVAVKAADPNDAEGLAWCHVQLGNELMNAGQLQIAEREFDEALRIFPDHPLALRAKANARLATGDVQGAIKISEMEGDSADAAQMLGDLYTRLGHHDAAQQQYAKFEKLERANAEFERSWRHMINYWLDHDRNLSEALTLAKREYETRKDIFTCDALAWALFKNGQLPEARRMMKEALRTGTKDPRIRQHANVIG